MARASPRPAAAWNLQGEATNETRAFTTMRNPLSRWLRPRPPAREGRAPDSLEKELSALEREARRAPSGLRGQALNRAGDLCFKAGDPQRALGYYGRAIDVFLEDQQPEPGRGVAQKIIRLHPNAIRTLCTLTWLDLSAGLIADATEHLEGYVDAVERGGREEIARGQILEMARAVPTPEFRSAAAEALLRLDAPKAADEVFGLVREGDRVAEIDRAEIREVCLRAATESKVAWSGGS